MHLPEKPLHKYPISYQEPTLLSSGVLVDLRKGTPVSEIVKSLHEDYETNYSEQSLDTVRLHNTLLWLYESYEARQAYYIGLDLLAEETRNRKNKAEIAAYRTSAKGKLPPEILI